MTLPDPQLTDYVDGALNEADRGAVETHLATCATCRREVALARSARDALGSLPAVAPPPGLADAAIAEAAAPTPAQPTSLAGRRAAARWIGGAVAVAAALVLVAVAAPKLGGGPARTAAEGTSADAAPSFDRATAVDVVRANLTFAQLPAVTAGLGGVPAPQADAGTTGANAVTATSAPQPALDVRQRLPDRLPVAARCLDKAWQNPDGELTRVVLARYEGTPAYFGVYAVGPGAGLPPTQLQLYAASIDGCAPLASSYVRI
jgi:anti-sigma factor RsiW